MQPLALKNFSDVVYSYLEPIIGSGNISMFTVVVDKYNFGQDNWNFRYKSFQKKMKKILKGYANFTHLKRFKIYDLAFAGGKGKEVLRNIIDDIEKEN